jgi:hypothetical protein
VNRRIWHHTAAHQPKLFYFILACIMLLSLAGCSQSNAPVQAALTPRPTPTVSTPTQPASSPTPAPGTVLYTANWSHGLGNWHASPAWSIVQGQLQVNSISETTITVPYTPTTPNYAIEVRVQLIQVLKKADNQFFVVDQPNSQSDGFDAGFLSLYQPSNLPAPNFYAGFIQVIAKNLNANAGIQQIDYVPGYRMHTYRVEVSGDQATLSVDGSIVSRSTSLENTFSTGPIVLDSSGLLLRIGGLRIIAI